MARIRKVRPGTYQLIVSCGYDMHGKQKQAYKTYHCTSKTESAQQKEAYKAAVIFEKNVKQGGVIPSDIRFYQYYETWRKLYGDPENGHLSLGSYQNYCENIERWFIPEIGNKKIQEITSTDIDFIIEKLKENHVSSSIHKIISALDSVFNLALSKHIIRENPVKYCSIPKIKDSEKKKVHAFTVEQANTFLDAITRPYPVEYNRKGTKYTELKTMPTQLQAYFYLSIYGGFRRGELLALTWHDIDMDTGTISVTKAMSIVKDEEGHLTQRLKSPKTEQGVRPVTVPKSCLDLLSRWKMEERELAFKMGDTWKGASKFENQFVFVQTDTGKMMDAATPRQAFRRFIENFNAHHKEKLPLIRLHDLRHTTATLLLQAGADITQIQQRLGHRKASTTWDYYIEKDPERDKQASKLLESYLNQA